MLLNSVILVLREVLEAALLLSILLAMTRFLQMGWRWFAIATVLGAGGAVLYGNYLGGISAAFEGVGQELLNATLQLLIFLLLLLIAALFVVNHYHSPFFQGLLQWLMAVAVAAAILREGSEIYIYLMAFREAPELFGTVIVGALLGAGIGFSIGALLYYLLLTISRTPRLWVACVLLALVAAGMTLQAVQLLLQADWLPEQTPLWDSSALLAETSVLGQLLYALVGYEATPTPLEVVIYLASLTFMVAVLGVATFASRRQGLGRRL